MECDYCHSCLLNAVEDGRLKDVRGYVSSSELSDSQRFDTLCLAIKNNQTEVTKLLLQNGFEGFFDCWNRGQKVEPFSFAGHSAREEAEIKMGPFQLALENGNMKIIEMFLEKGVEINSYFASKLLCDTVEKSSEEGVKFLLNKGANANFKGKSGITSLNIAVKREHLKITEHLLINGGNVNTKYPTEDNRTLLHLAVLKGNLAMVKLLIKYGADVNAQRTDGSTALHLAIKMKAVCVVKYLLCEGATVNFAISPVQKKLYEKNIDEKGQVKNLVRKPSLSAKKILRTPIDIAIDVGYEKIVELLLDYGAYVDTQNCFGETVLQLAVKRGCLLIIKHVLHHCPDKNKEANRKAFYYAANNGYGTLNKRVFHKLVEYGYTVCPEDVNNYELLTYSIKNNYSDFVEKLIEYGFDVNQTLPSFEEDISALWLAVTYECEETVKLLLNHGADIKLKPLWTASLLSVAVEKGNVEIAKLLLEKEANLQNDPHILAVAAKQGCLELVEILLKKGAKVNSNVEPALHLYDAKSALYVAAEGGYFEIVDLLLKHGAEVDLENLGTTPLMIAAKKGHLKIVETLLKYGASVFFGHYHSTDILYHAAINGHDEVVKLLLKYGAEIQSYGITSGSLLIASASRGHLKTVEILLKAGAEVNARNRDGTALNVAANKGYDEIVKVLLENSANPDSKPEYECNNMTPLLLYSKKGQLELVEILLKLGASISSTDEFNRTALHFAAKNSHEEVVNILLKHGVGIDVKDKYGMTALHVSAGTGFCKITEILLKNGACIDTCDRFGRTVLFIAVEEGHDKIVKFLLKRSVEVNSKAKTNIAPLLIRSERDYIFGKRALLSLEYEYRLDVDSDDSLSKALYCAWGPDCAEVYCVHDVLRKYRDKLDTETGINMTPLLRAVTKKNLKCAELLLKFGANLELAGSDGKTPLCVAIERYHIAMVKLLLEYDAKIDSILKKGKTPLIIATENCCTSRKEAQKFKNAGYDVMESFFLEIVELLLKFGANTEAITDDGKTALGIAVENENLGAVNLLLEYGANVDINMNKDVMTPLLWASQNGDLKIVEILLKFGANINSKDCQNRDALYFAVEKGHHDVVETLLDHGAKVNSLYEERLTILHLAAKNNCLDIIKALINVGTAIDSTNSLGETPLYIATKFGQSEVVEHLLKSGSEVDCKSTDGMTPLLASLNSGHPKIVKVLLGNGARTNDVDLFNRIALLAVSRRNSKERAEIVQTLLECGSVDEKMVCKTNVRKLLDILNQEAVRDHRNHSILKDCAKVVVCYTIKMEAANLHSSDDKLVAVSYNDESEISAFRNSCEAELAKMKSKIIKNTNVSFYDVLSKNIDQLARIANNENIIQVFKSDGYRTKFPIYSSILSSQFQKGEMRKNLLEKSTKICRSLFQHFSLLPYDLIEYLLNYILNEDLRNIVRCWNITTSNSVQL